MINKDILEKLIQLSEGSLTAENWKNWWIQNEHIVEKEISRGWFLKIKLWKSQGIDRAALISQHNARNFLKSINQDFTIKFENDYKKNWLKSIDESGEKAENDFKIYFKTYFEDNFENLNKRYPNFYIAIKENFISGDIVKKEFSKEDILQKPFSEFLTEEMIIFFSNISLLKFNDLSLDFESIGSYKPIYFKNEEYLKIGELWMYGDGDEILIKKNNDKVYLNIIGVKIKLLNNSFYNFIEFDLADFMKDDDDDIE